jgi:ribonucleotide monophosphatase NagD (HAD superfamily)
VIYAGKPYGPIYDRALALAGRVRRAPVEKRRVLAIGDGMKTDIIGARQAGLDALFVTGGIHRSLHKKGLTSPADPDALRQLCEENGVSPVAAIPMLRP